MVGRGGVHGSTAEATALEEPQPSIPALTMSSMPGLLTLSPSRAEALVAREPLHQLYTVENQPFARYIHILHFLIFVRKI